MNPIKAFSFLSILVVSALPLVLNAEISPIKTVLAIAEEVVEYQMLDGQIEAVNKSTVSAQTGGVISKLSYDVGDFVKKGSLIARISSQNQKSGVLEAKASVDQSRASISGAGASMTAAKASIVRASAAITQAEAMTKEAQANYSVARSEFDRVKGLFAKRILTKSQYDQAEATMRSSLARVESSKASQKSAEADRVAAQSRLSSAKANLTSAKASLSSSKASLSKAGEQLGYTEVVAPYSGIVTERLVELGEVVSSGTPIMTGISLEQMRAVANIPQRLFLKIREHKSALLYIEGNKEGIPATKLTFFPYADPATNAFQVRVAIDSAVKGLFPGVFVKIGFEVGKDKHLVVPMSAIAHRSEVTGVYVVDQNSNMPALRQVRLGSITADNKVRVLSGLDEGETIALDPVHAAVYLKQKQLDAAVEAGEAHE
ncbi:MAG: efflux RND transporter periplasmic adaptor subunit [Cocleimonas sp.]